VLGKNVEGWFMRNGIFELEQTRNKVSTEGLGSREVDQIRKSTDSEEWKRVLEDNETVKQAALRCPTKS
jgi:hypothetical protein